jgi:phosphoribosylamine--glycine ligase/phosphoribosylglycinamide formyltransferase/phosphoribosylformylglycinamidine cyclo-ligase
VKASGLAAGKGVIVASTNEEACQAVDEILGDRKFGNAGDTVVIEEKLVGEEVSVLALVDAHTVRLLLPAQDHKRLKDNDQGLNTGGMGAYCPCPLIKPDELSLVNTEVLQRAVDGLRSENIQYKGILYAGMMLTPNGPKTLEFNCRFGDPETQVILPLLETDLFELMDACCDNQLQKFDSVKFKTNCSAVGVVMASKGYPETSTKGCVIRGIERVAAKEDHLVFHSGVSKDGNGDLVTNGGRVLINVAFSKDLKVAAALATSACREIQFEGAQFRSDIARKAFEKVQLSYKDSGVDIDAGDSLVQRIKPLARGTMRPGILGDLGGFGGLFRLSDLPEKYRDPVLVQGTDGVGTKLKIAEEIDLWDTIGEDLVAMCANDVLCAGAEPLSFLDYIACGKLNVPTAGLIVKGIAEGCRKAGCALVGGETAEMPAIYSPGKYDLAGYCVGIVEHSKILPKIGEIKEGDILIGLPSSGVHSNGFSLVNKILEAHYFKLHEEAPFSETGETFGRELLRPTKIYVPELLPLLKKDMIKALAHITGGGITENVPRVLPDNLAVEIDGSSFRILPVFGWLAAKGNICAEEMLRTFNCGIGMVLIMDRSVDWHCLKGHGAVEIGRVIQRSDKPVIVQNFQTALDLAAQPFQDESIVPSLSYKDSGVDISAGDGLVQNIKPHAKSTNKPGVLGGLGGFGGLFRLSELPKKYEDPVLVLGTDGVGTKLKIAQKMAKHDTIGQDLVAMCANDVLCVGAEPLTFLDYFACGKLDVETATQVISGIAEGCRMSGSVLLGGETAEMPGMYQKGVYDLAGFSLGIVDYKNILPRKSELLEGDIIIGLPSNGLHSNGFSLVHKLMEMASYTLSDVAPFSCSQKSFGEELLAPTRIYIKEVLPALQTGLVKAVAHITGGGMWDNIPRILSPHLTAEINGKLLNMQPIFGWLASTGNISKLELMRTFNCGLGMILVANPEHEAELMRSLWGSGASVIGKLIPTKPNGHQCIVRHFGTCIERVQELITVPKKRVAVLISGNGSNLQALIDASRDSNHGLYSEISFVISNKSGIFGLERCLKEGIPHKVINHKDYKSREEFDEAMSQELENQSIDLICLAGFMRILSAEFVRKWKGKILNIHPSLLPKYKGLHPQKQALESGDAESGCSVHFVDENVDTGANIVQEIVPILPGDTEESLTKRIHQVEYVAYPKALRLVASGYVRLAEDGKTEWV